VGIKRFVRTLPTAWL